MGGNKIANEDFSDAAKDLQEKLSRQLGDDKVIGCSMFFLVKEAGVTSITPETEKHRNYWVIVSNYTEPLTDANLLYLHQSVARHLAKDFSCVDYGPDDNEEKL